MAIIAGSTATTYEIIPAGNHVARCYSMIHIGTIETLYMGKPKILNKVRIGFETPLECREFKEGEGVKPFTIAKEFTLSLYEMATLRKVLESWRGKGFTEDEIKGFDIEVLVGKSCMLNIIHKQSKDGSKTYAEISNISPIPKGLICPDQFNTTQLLSYDKFSEPLFDSLPDFIKDKMKTSEEYKKMLNPGATEDKGNGHKEEEDDLPF